MTTHTSKARTKAPTIPNSAKSAVYLREGGTGEGRGTPTVNSSGTCSLLDAQVQEGGLLWEHEPKPGQGVKLAGSVMGMPAAQRQRVSERRGWGTGVVTEGAQV